MIRTAAKTRNEDLVTRQVRSRVELEAALRLVHDNYVERGYMQPHPSGIRIGIHYALPSTRTYVAVLQDQVIATLSLFVDSPLGLPLDALYADITGGLRVAGRGLGEVGMLADRRRALSRGVDVLLHLMKHVFWDARNDRLDDLLITVNPRHVKFYERLLCFQQLGPVREYRAVRNAAAVLLRIEISKVQPADAPSDEIREIFFSPLEDNGPRYQMRREDLAYFFVEKTDLFRRLAEAQARAIEEQFPALRLADLLVPAGLPTGPAGPLEP